jgi:RNA polymerase sigma-70 factor (ECF subfamily)
MLRASKNNNVIYSQGKGVLFDEVYRDHYKLLFAKAYALLDDKGKAEDAVQEFFMELWERKTSIHINGSIITYLLVCIHYKCGSLLSKEQRSQKKLQGYIYDLMGKGEYELSFSFLKDEVSDPRWPLVQYARHQLSRNQEDVIRKCYDEGKTYEETAAEMKISRNTVQSHIQRSLTKFRNIFMNNCGPTI